MARLYDKLLVTVGNNTYHPCGDKCQSQVLKGAVNDSLRLGDHCRENDWLVFSSQNVQGKTEMLTLAQQANYRITPATSVVVFHYSGHAEDFEGETHLLMCGGNTNEHEPGDDSPKRRCHCPDREGKALPDGRVQLHDVLEHLCRKIARRTKVLVLIDGCRTAQGIPKELKQTDGLKGVQLMIVYACGRGRQAQEHEINGCWHGSFTLAFLNSMRHHETLASLIEDVQGKTFSLSGPRFAWTMQDCSISIQGGWDYTSAPNFFRAQAVQKVADECCKLKEALQDAEEKLAKASERAKELRSQKQALKAECERLIEELRLRNMGSKMDQQNIERLRNKLKDLQTKYREIQACLLEELSQSQEAKIERESLRQQLDLKKEHLRKLSADQNKAYEQSDASQEQVEALKVQLRKLAEENDRLKAQISICEQKAAWREQREVLMHDLFDPYPVRNLRTSPAPGFHKAWKQ